MKKLINNMGLFLGVFFVVLLSSTGAFAGASDDIANQAKDIYDAIKPLVFIAAAIYLIYKGVDGVISGSIDWKDVLKVIGPLFIFLVAGYLVEIFSGGAATSFID